MQEYFEHAAPDGTLATLGELGAEQDFYANSTRPARSTHSTRSTECGHNKVNREGELRRVQVPPAMATRSR